MVRKDYRRCRNPGIIGVPSSSGMLELGDSVCGALCDLKVLSLSKATQIIDGVDEEHALIHFEGNSSLKNYR